MKYSLFAGITVPFDQIERIEITSKALKEDSNFAKLSPLGAIDSHNMILHFDSTLIINGFYGKEEECRALAIFIDDKSSFIKVMTEERIIVV